MAKMMLGFNNFGDHAALSLGSWAIPLTQMQDPRPGMFAKSTDATLASTKYGINFGASKSLRLIATLATNLTSASLYKVTWYSDAFITAIDDSGWNAIPGYPSYDPHSRGADVCHIFDEATSAFAVKWEFDDTANPAGYVTLGRQYHGETWLPPLNFSQGNSEGEDVYTEEEESAGGSSYFVVRAPKRRLRLPWEIFEETENPTIRRIRALSGTHNQVLVVPDPDDVTNYFARNFLAYMRTPPEIALLPAGFASTAFELREAR